MADLENSMIKYVLLLKDLIAQYLTNKIKLSIFEEKFGLLFDKLSAESSIEEIKLFDSTFVRSNPTNPRFGQLASTIKPSEKQLNLWGII